ncbi:flagellar biosynthetic protein FliO [Alcaligenes sp. SORT26]|uniref:flagellar biosynthetic protein FliO n=1 Tax=Alcaligenes sp. SORT26 TaxID=2813780 RepID=UPI001A9FB516|nr:flagellar biosynthetic protein FliO [Alcaligenes sp. SORT26]QTC00097.1 flagellar biosynthetic protein FliO [Alcaligenes sp. SORT26]
MLSLLLVVGLILAAAWVARRGGLLKSKSQQRIKILDNQRLGPRSSVALIQIDNREILIGITPQQISLLHTRTPAEPEPDFQAHLDQHRAPR